MAETELGNKFAAGMRKLGVHIVRVENVAEDGTPDYNYAFERAEGWIETKEAKGSYLYFELFQIPWFRKRLRATRGRDVWVLATVKDRINLYAAHRILEADRVPAGKWVRVRHKELMPDLVLDFTRPNWAALIEALTDPNRGVQSSRTV